MEKTAIQSLHLDNRTRRSIKFLEHSSKFGGLVAVAIVLSACASTAPPQSVGNVSAANATGSAITTVPGPASASVAATVSQKPAATAGSLTKPAMETQVMGAVTSPLSDFNLIRAEISPELNAAMKGPYLMPADKSCEGIGAEVSALDRIIGPDLDAPVEKDADLMTQGQNELSNAAIGALRSTFEGVIPFRSWIRRFSGADRHSKGVNAALAAGVVRRAFLKGLGQASGCVAPAAPVPPAEPTTTAATATSTTTPVASSAPVMPANKVD